MRLACLLSFAAVGCGDYVAYGELPPASIADFPAVERLDHLGLSPLVMRFAGGDPVRVDYRGMAASPEAGFVLAQYRGSLAAVDPAALDGTAERLALWLNAYNASVIDGVLARFGGDLGFRVTDDPAFFTGAGTSVGGESLSLDQIEHGVIRGDWDHPSVAGTAEPLATQLRAWHAGLGSGVDPRIHAALNCGARSCPDLFADRPFVYDARSLDRQLDTQTRAWINDPTRGAGASGISRLFDWYAGDFIASHGSVAAFIAAFHDNGGAGVDTGAFLDYDWTLNATGD